MDERDSWSVLEQCEYLTHARRSWGRLTVLPHSLPSHSVLKVGFIQETLLIVTLRRFPSVVLVMLCPHLTRRPDDNTTVAPCNMAVNDHEVRRILTCGYPQCSLGPSPPERSTHCLVPCYPQYEFPLGIREVSLLPFLGVPMVCAVPFSEAVPSGVELADVDSSLVSGLSFTVLGTEWDIFCRSVDPPRGIEVEGRIPAQGANRPGVTESKKGIPMRGLNPLSPTMLKGQLTAENCPTWVTTRASPSIGRGRRGRPDPSL